MEHRLWIVTHLSTPTPFSYSAVSLEGTGSFSMCSVRLFFEQQRTHTAKKQVLLHLNIPMSLCLGYETRCRLNLWVSLWDSLFKPSTSSMKCAVQGNRVTKAFWFHSVCVWTAVLTALTWFYHVVSALSHLWSLFFFSLYCCCWRTYQLLHQLDLHVAACAPGSFRCSDRLCWKSLF